MYKYYMEINGDFYVALFENIDELSIFLEDNNREGDRVEMFGCDKITSIYDILNDKDFEQSYIDEMACIYLLGQIECRKRFSKEWQMHKYLQIKGYLD